MSTNGTGFIDPDQVGYAKTIRRLALGNPVAKKILLDLPARPFDYCGLANLLISTPDITRRPPLVRRWIESQTHLPPDAAALLRRTFHRADDEPDDEGPGEAEQEGPKRSDLGILDVATFSRRHYPREFLVSGIIVKGRPGILGGPQKALKTTTAIDLAVSAASATRFLDTFEVPKVVKTLLISGESGEATIQETVRRICRAKGIDPDEMATSLFVGFNLPQLSDPEQLEALADFIRVNGIELVVIDPLYLCLIGAGSRIDPSNLFDVGPLLKRITKTCLDAGATPILLHHFRKNRESPFAPPEMEDLAFAGIQEFARQWLLIGRRERYEPGSGEHRLWLSVGGSDGHSGCWALDVSEGIVGAEFRDREWNVAVAKASEARDEAKQQALQAKVEKVAEQTRTKDEAKERSRHDDAEKALAHLKHTGPKSKTSWRDGMGWNAARIGTAVELLLSQGRIRPATVQVHGSGTKTWQMSGYEFATDDLPELTPDNPGQPRILEIRPGLDAGQANPGREGGYTPIGGIPPSPELVGRSKATPDEVDEKAQGRPGLNSVRRGGT